MTFRVLLRFILILIFSSVAFAAEVIDIDFNTLQGGFMQRSIVDGDVVDVKKGVFFIKKPNMFRWDLDKDKTIFAYKNSFVTIDHSLEKIEFFKGNVAIMKFVLSLNFNRLDSRFNIKLYKSSHNDRVYRIWPKSKEDSFDYAEVVVDRLIKKIRIYRSKDDLLEITFLDQSVNKDININKFEVIMPVSYEVVEREI